MTRAAVRSAHSAPDTRPLIIGIDPGLHGALAAVDWATDKLVSIHDMPTLKVKGRTVLDLPHLNRIVRAWANDAKFAVVEDPDSAMPTDGRTSALRFGKNIGAALMAVVAAGIPMVTVKPSMWKPALSVPADKALAVVRAETIFGHEGVFRGPRGGGLDGRAEAALLAWFGVRRLNQ